MGNPKRKGEMIGRGRTAEIFSWGSERVLKLFLKDYPFTGVEKEARITQAAHNANLPVPAVDEIVEVDGRQGIVFERIDGPILSAAMLSRPWKFPQLARLMADLRMTIHSCELPGLPSQRDDLRRIIEDRVSLQDATKEALLETLEQLPDGSALCHGDFHPDNIIVSSRGLVIIDWLTVKRGNPIADIVRTSLLLRVGTPPGCNAVSRRLHTFGGSLIYSVYLKRYTQLKAFPHQQMYKWLPVVAAARLAEHIPEEKSKLLVMIKTGLPPSRTTARGLSAGEV